MVKNPPAHTGDAGDVGSIPGPGRSLEEGNGNLPQYSCRENPMDRGVWWATGHLVAKSWTQLITHTHARHYAPGLWRNKGNMAFKVPDGIPGITRCSINGNHFAKEIAHRKDPRDQGTVALFLSYSSCCPALYSYPPLSQQAWYQERLAQQ